MIITPEALQRLAAASGAPRKRGSSKACAARAATALVALVASAGRDADGLLEEALAGQLAAGPAGLAGELWSREEIECLGKPAPLAGATQGRDQK